MRTNITPSDKAFGDLKADATQRPGTPVAPLPLPIDSSKPQDETFTQYLLQLMQTSQSIEALKADHTVTLGQRVILNTAVADLANTHLSEALEEVTKKLDTLGSEFQKDQQLREVKYDAGVLTEQHKATELEAQVKAEMAAAVQAEEYDKLAALGAKPAGIKQASETKLQSLLTHFQSEKAALRSQYEQRKLTLEKEKQKLATALEEHTSKIDSYTQGIASLTEKITQEENELAGLITARIKQVEQVSSYVGIDHTQTEKTELISQYEQRRLVLEKEKQGLATALEEQTSKVASYAQSTGLLTEKVAWQEKELLGLRTNNQEQAKEIAQLKQQLQVAEAPQTRLLQEQPRFSPSTSAPRSGQVGSRQAGGSSLFTLPISPISKVQGPPVDQVKVMAAHVASGVDPSDVTALFKWAAEGHLIEVGNLLKKNPKLGVATRSFKDLSDREFKDMTVFQYAAWALDMEMCEEILPYLEGPIASVQLKALEGQPDTYSAHGPHYDFTPLIESTQKYLDNYSQWNNDQRCQVWQQEVGGAQRQCPAWYWYLWTEQGKDVAWTKQDVNRPYQRKYESGVNDYGLTWAFNYSSDNGVNKGVGGNWAVARGKTQGSQQQMHSDSGTQPMITLFAGRDNRMHKLMSTSRTECLRQLRTRLVATQEHEIQHTATQIPGMQSTV